MCDTLWVVSASTPEVPLPRVDQSDLHLVAIDDLLDPSHQLRWKQFATDNPEFAREILLEAERLKLAGNTVEQAAINIATFALDAYKHAIVRASHASESSQSTVDDEDLPPLDA